MRLIGSGGNAPTLDWYRGFLTKSQLGIQSSPTFSQGMTGSLTRYLHNECRTGYVDTYDGFEHVWFRISMEVKKVHSISTWTLAPGCLPHDPNERGLGYQPVRVGTGAACRLCAKFRNQAPPTCARLDWCYTRKGIRHLKGIRFLSCRAYMGANDVGIQSYRNLRYGDWRHCYVGFGGSSRIF